MPSQVALAGATGNLGRPILQALLDAGHSVTVLSRQGSHAAARLPQHANVTVHHVDFASVASITQALQSEGIQVVVSCLATLAIDSQTPLIDAAFDAGVERFIPAEFGMDSANPRCAALPVCAPKVAVQHYLRQKHRERSTFTFTAIANGLFLDWGLEQGLLANLRDHTATLYNGGDVPFSVTNLADVAQAVVGVIAHAPETANRVVYVQTVRVTQKQLLDYAQARDGQKWTTVVKDTEELKEESMVELEKGVDADVEGAMLGFCFCGATNPDYGCDFSDRLDNVLLGVREKSLGEALDGWVRQSNE